MKKRIYLSILILILTITGQAQIPTEGLIGYWPFTGNPADSSGNGNDGILHGTTLTNDRFMIENRAYSFNHSYNDYIETNILDSSLTNYTALGWFYWKGTQNVHALGTFLIGEKGWCWKAYNNKVRLLHNNKVIYSTIDIVPYTWFHVAIRFNGTEASIFVNGKFDNSDTASNTMGEYFLIGAIPKYTSDFNWDGYIDNVFLYNRALDSSEIYSIYTEGKCNQILYDTITLYDTIPIYNSLVYDTIPVYDTISIYDSIAITDTLIIDVDLPVDLNVLMINTIKVYPNPTKDKLFINIGIYYSEMEDYSIKIVNSYGEIIFETNFENIEYIIDMNDFGETGLFFVKIIDPDQNVIDVRKILLY